MFCTTCLIAVFQFLHDYSKENVKYVLFPFRAPNKIYETDCSFLFRYLCVIT